MPSLVYFTRRLPSKIADELAAAGYQVFEALAISEVLHLSETENADAVIVDASVQDPSVTEIQKRRITLRLEPEAKSKGVIWELSHLFPWPRPHC